jgi:hypothetical protein
MKIAFEWQRRHHKILGDLYIPVAYVEIKTRDGKWGSVVLKVDSSADTILMDENDCSVLGYTFDGCREYSYYDINRHFVKCFVRNFDIKIGNFIIKDVPISFSIRPIAESLLGCARIFDTLDILFNSTTKHTVFATRP